MTSPIVAIVAYPARITIPIAAIRKVIGAKMYIAICACCYTRASKPQVVAA